MKKLFTPSAFLVVIILITHNMCLAQNVFPSSGNVGIGTLNPTQKLSVIGGSIKIGDENSPQYVGRGSDLVYGGLSTDLALRSDNGSILFSASGTERVRILSSGNVSIGTATPSVPLDVVGTIRSNSFLRTTNVGTGAGYFADDAWGSTIFSISRQANNETRFQSFGFHTFYSGGSTGSEKMRIDAAGNVGIGTSTPGNRLEVFGSTFNRISAIVDTDVQNGFQAKKSGVNATNWEFYIPAGSSDFRFYNGGLGDILSLKSNGNVGIGTTSPNSYKLAVAGPIGAWGEVRVFTTGSAFPDYVFDPTYQLPSLDETEKYVKENHHLPEVPSAKEIEKDGMSLNEMNVILLKKVEELTFYMIEMKKEIRELKENQKK